MKIAVYPGSFDPFTIGHLDVLKNAAGLFDEVYVAVLNNSAKSPVFSIDERVEMIGRMIKSEGFRNVRSGSFSGLLVDYAKQIGAQYIIRGLRARCTLWQIPRIRSCQARMCVRSEKWAVPSKDWCRIAIIIIYGKGWQGRNERRTDNEDLQHPFED